MTADRVMIVIETIAIGKRGPRYCVRLANGEAVLESTRLPFCDGARELLRRGHAPSTIIEMRHKGASIVAMRGMIGKVAALTVVETDKVGPVFARWKPFPDERSEARTVKTDPEVV